MYSYHNFLFPFRFDKIVKPFNDKHEFYKNNTFDERVKIDKYVSMKENEKSIKVVNRLQYIGFPLLVLSFITGFFGMNIFPQNFLNTIANWLENLF